MFGWSVATAGDVDGDGYADVVVGAPKVGEPFLTEGKAYLFRGSASGLLAAPAWSFLGGEGMARLGSSVHTAGDVNGDGYADVLVGAEDYGTTGDDWEAGQVFVFLGSDLGLNEDWYDATAGETPFASLGTSVCAAGDVNGDGYGDVILGAPHHSNPDPADLDEGKAYLYYGSGSGLSKVSRQSVESGQSDSYFAWSAATAGDVNGDGYSDLIVGAHQYDETIGGQGKVFVYHGTNAGYGPDADWEVVGDQLNAFFGYSVARAGDVNGDGYGDVIVGAIGGGDDAEGTAAVYLGSSEGLALDPAWTAESDQNSARFGWCVATAGDVNGDGYSEVIVGSPYYESGGTREGRAFLWYGGPGGLGADGTPGNAGWRADSDDGYADLGFAVGTAGDVNGDGFSDVIVGSGGYTHTETHEGAAFVWFGPSGFDEDGTPDNANWKVYGGQDNAHFGLSVGTAGDVDGDGYSDVIVGAPEYRQTESQEGGAFLYRGRASGLNAFSAWSEFGGEAFASFGASVGTAGDVNGDGLSDVVVGSPRFDAGGSNRGRMIVYHGNRAWGGLDPVRTMEDQGSENEARFGDCVASAGDLNGDGFGDVVVGAYRQDGIVSDAGRATVYYGNQADNLFASVRWDGVARTPRQMRAGEAVPIDLLGTSDWLSSFDVNALGRTPAGRARVRLEWQAEALGDALEDGELTRGSWLMSGPPVAGAGSSVPLDERVSGLAAGEAYHWRTRIGSDSPFFPWSRWLSLPYNNPTETDLRMPDFIEASAIVPVGHDVGVDLGPFVKVFFQDVTAPGVAWLSVVAEDFPSPPSPFLGLPAGSPLYYQLYTNAGRAGTIAVCIHYGEGDVLESESALQMMQYFSSAGWQPIPTMLDATQNQACGTTTSLGAFLLAEYVTQTGVPAPAAPSSTAAFRLDPNVPNPFNPVTTIRYSVPAAAHVRLTVYDVTGRLVRVLEDAEVMEAGEHGAVWNGRASDGRAVASGVYFARLEAGEHWASRRMVLMK